MNKSKGSLYITMFLMVILPMTVVTIVAFLLCGNYYINAIGTEVEKELKNICAITRTAMEDLYPGDYSLVGDEEKVVLKGETVLNGDYTVPDRIKENTGVEVTIFYYDTRILTTITNQEGERIVGTGANATVMRDVYDGRQPGFYQNVNIMGNNYYAYYEPIINSDENIVGMLFAGKKVEDVRETSIIYLLPMIMVLLVLIFLEGLICMFWARNTIKHISVIQNFLMVMSEGKFSRELSPVITARDDEIGRLGIAVVRVQGAIRDLIERDMLTGLHNRRFGFARLEEVKNQAHKSGVPFCVVMCDIDHFKHFNDTYGHDAGDMVLKEVARLFKNNMAGKGFTIRWGGEEFLLVFSGYNMDDALPILEDIREKLKAMELHYMEEVLHVTMSFGMANGNPVQASDIFIKEADDRLYYAKEHGRDQIVTMIPWWEEAPADEPVQDTPSPQQPTGGIKRSLNIRFVQSPEGMYSVPANDEQDIAPAVSPTQPGDYTTAEPAVNTNTATQSPKRKRGRPRKNPQ